MPRSQPKKPLLLLEPAQNDWQIAKLVPGGAGFLKLANGQGAFAPGALPGELIRVEQAEDHKTYLQATRWSLLEASPDRVEPSCSVQQQCGGCDLMTLAYAAQVQAKAGILHDALTRTGRFEQLPEIRFVASPEPLRYRTRIRLHVASGARLGFYAAESRDLVEIPACPVAHPELEAALSTLRSIARRYAPDVAKLAEVELRVAPAGPRLSVHLLPADRSFDPAAPLVAALSRSFQVSIAERAASPEQDQRYPLPGAQLRVPGGGFNQVNWAVNQLLVQAVLDGVQRTAALSFCDLYCGAGNFSLPLLARGLVGLGIESSRTGGRRRQAAPPKSNRCRLASSRATCASSWKGWRARRSASTSSCSTPHAAVRRDVLTGGNYSDPPGATPHRLLRLRPGDSGSRSANPVRRRLRPRACDGLRYVPANPPFRDLGLAESRPVIVGPPCARLEQFVRPGPDSAE